VYCTVLAFFDSNAAVSRRPFSSLNLTGKWIKTIAEEGDKHARKKETQEHHTTKHKRHTATTIVKNVLVDIEKESTHQNERVRD